MRPAISGIVKTLFWIYANRSRSCSGNPDFSKISRNELVTANRLVFSHKRSFLNLSLRVTGTPNQRSGGAIPVHQPMVQIGWNHESPPHHPTAQAVAAHPAVLADCHRIESRWASIRRWHPTGSLKPSDSFCSRGFGIPRRFRINVLFSYRLLYRNTYLCQG